MIIVTTNRAIFESPISQITPVSVPQLGVTIGKLLPEGNRLYTGILDEDQNDINFYPKEQLGDVFSNVPDEDMDLPWVFFLHGFHQDPQENINKAKNLSKYHRVNVIVFAWPSRPLDYDIGWDEALEESARSYMTGTAIPAALLTGLVNKAIAVMKDRWKNYDPAIENAKKSDVDLMAALEMVNTYLSEEERPVLLVHSMGNYLLENTLTNNSQLSMKFSNIILHQADATSPGYDWVNQLTPNLAEDAKLYITSNAYDYVLAASQAMRKLRGKTPTGRIGQNRQHYLVNDICYLDFTDGPHVEDEHEFFQRSDNETNSHVFSLLGRLFRAENDQLPIGLRQSDNGFTRMPTEVLLYRLEKIIDPADTEYDENNDHLIPSLNIFRDPLLPREDPYSE